MGVGVICLKGAHTRIQTQLSKSEAHYGPQWNRPSGEPAPLGVWVAALVRVALLAGVGWRCDRCGFAAS